MKQINLIKFGRDPNVCHLYEHMFCIKLVELFDDHKLFDYLDYSFYAASFGNGIIHIKILLYTPEAQALLGEIKSLKFPIDFSGQAHVQIIAEKQAEITCDDTRVDAELNVLQETPWHHTAIKPGKVSQERAITFLQTPSKNFIKMRARLVLSSLFAKQNPQLLPLFHVASQALLNNVSHGLTDYYYYFGADSRSNYTARAVWEEHLFRAYKNQTQKLTDEIDMCKDIIALMLEEKAIEKLVALLQKTGRNLASPNNKDVFETTGVRVSAQIWKKLSTPENFRAVLQNCQLTLMFGKQRQQLQLSELLRAKR